jgi:hypothetical protein
VVLVGGGNVFLLHFAIWIAGSRGTVYRVSCFLATVVRVRWRWAVPVGAVCDAGGRVARGALAVSGES